MGIHSFLGLGFLWISASHKISRNPFWYICFFPYFSGTMGIHSSLALGIAWISASWKIFKKPLTSECLCFPISFFIVEVHIPHVLSIVCVHRKILSRSMSGRDRLFPSILHELGKNIPIFPQKTTTWKWYGFPQNISRLWEFVDSQTLRVFINSKSER